ncbi:MAG: DegT/DnrJ/EryC1/StrS family aminotransferase [Candidatus Bipolaricaulia bacterium]
MGVPFDPLGRQYSAISAEIDRAIKAVLSSGRYILGENVMRFEEEFARYCGTKYAVGISSGTAALHLALLACGVGPGDEVITAANTYIATIFAISYVGARPVLVDIDPESYTLDIAQVERAITERTGAIIPVHLYGQCADMDPIMKLARNYGLKVIEDAAQAHGAEYKGRRAGSFGDAGCFSFYPSKNLGACGDGGAVVTNDKEIYEKLRIYRYMGQPKKHLHLVIGYQERLDELQAAILRIKLRHLDRWNEQRRKWAALYDKLLADTPVVCPKEQPYGRHVYHLYVIRVKWRDAVKARLAEAGIETQIHYPTPAHLQPAYANIGYAKGSFPITERYSEEILSLPLYPELKEEEVREVAQELKLALERLEGMAHGA